MLVSLTLSLYILGNIFSETNLYKDGYIVYNINVQCKLQSAETPYRCSDQDFMSTMIIEPR